MTEPGSGDRLVDLAVYAPIGLALTALESLPRWVERGRRQMGARLDAARVVGRLAVDQGSRQSGDIMRRVAEQADNVMAGLGLVPDPPHPPDTAREADVADGADAADAAAERRATAVPPEVTTDAPVRSPSARSAPVGLDPAQLAIPGYDTLSASQVVQRLPGLSPEELEAVRLYEVAGRNRKTVLLKAAQLSGP